MRNVKDFPKIGSKYFDNGMSDNINICLSKYSGESTRLGKGRRDMWCSDSAPNKHINWDDIVVATALFKGV